MFASRHPDYFTLSRLRGSVLTLEGLIACGKSTAGKSLEGYFLRAGVNAKFFPEYTNSLLLEQYISNMKKYAYSFQLFMLCKRISIYQEAELFSRGGGVAIIDRSILGDMTFARMQHEESFISDKEWEIYQEVMRQEIKLVPYANIFLKCTPENSLRRVSLRGNIAEIKGYNVEYMEKLATAYEKTLSECTNVPHVILDWNTDLTLTDDRLLEDEDCREIIMRIFAVTSPVTLHNL